MGRTKKKEKKYWSHQEGEKGRNRVRVFEDSKTGIIQMEWYEGSRRRTLSLGHKDRGRAENEAKEAAEKFERLEELATKTLTLQTLFDIYRSEVTPEKSKGKQDHDLRTSEMFLRFFGSNTDVKSLTAWDVKRFVTARRSGRISPRSSGLGKGVRDRQVEYDLRFLLAVLKWATQRPIGKEKNLLDSHPLQDLEEGTVPRESSPNRPIMFQERYERMLSIASDVDWRFEVAFILAHETGHRIGAIRSLEWSDVDWESERILWRAQNDKIGMEHDSPLTSQAVEALQKALNENPNNPSGWVFPAPKDDTKPVDRHLMRKWWYKAERLANLPRKKGMGWHSLRRKFATELKETPLRDLAHLGGWRFPGTILACYQFPDRATQRNMVESRKPIREVSAMLQPRE